jgi:hypothetical protein
MRVRPRVRLGDPLLFTGIPNGCGLRPGPVHRAGPVGERPDERSVNRAVKRPGGLAGGRVGGLPSTPVMLSAS